MTTAVIIPAFIIAYMLWAISNSLKRIADALEKARNEDRA